MSGWAIGAPAWGSGAAPPPAPPGAPLALRGSGTQGAPFILADQRWWTWDNPSSGGPFDHFHIVEREAFYSGSGDRWDPASYTEDDGRPVIDFTTSGISAGTPDELIYAIPGHEAVGGANLLYTADSGLGVYSDRILTVTSVGPGDVEGPSAKAVSRATTYPIGTNYAALGWEWYDEPAHNSGSKTGDFSSYNRSGVTVNVNVDAVNSYGERTRVAENVSDHHEVGGFTGYLGVSDLGLNAVYVMISDADTGTLYLSWAIAG